MRATRTAITIFIASCTVSNVFAADRACNVSPGAQGILFQLAHDWNDHPEWPKDAPNKLAFVAASESFGLSLPLDSELAAAKAQYEKNRRDKQIGASARASGTTSAVEKPASPSLLGMAIENGAVQKSISGTTLTLSTSPYAIAAASLGDTASTYERYRVYNRISAVATFALTEPTEPEGSLANDQIKEWGVKVRLTPDASPRSADFSPQLTQLTMQDDLAMDIAATLNTYQPGLDPMSLEVIESANKVKGDGVEAIAVALACGVRQRLVPFLIQNITAAQRAELAPRYQELGKIDRGDILLQANAVATALASKPVASLAYANIRGAADTEDYSVFKLLWSQGAGGPLLFTANAGASFYHSPQKEKNQNTFRDIAFAISWEAPFEGRNGRFTLFSLGARYQRMFENRGVAGKRPDIAVVQAKLELPLGDVVTLPIAVTYANATEEIKGGHVRAHFGITVDTDKWFMVGRR